jgi:hypothetical protein
MESVVQAPARVEPAALAASGLPWHLAAALLGSTSIIVGLLWDISWHATIGRDTFWTPAHVAIYLGGVLAGFAGGVLALKATFAGSADERATAVRFWGFRAPLGAWVAIWGAIAMLTSAPFDDWWHNAYGLDVKILSPPHSLLAAGMMAIQLGAMLQVVALQNRAPAVAQPRLGLAYAYTAGVLLTMVATLLMEYSDPNFQHGARFYETACLAYPLVLLAAERGARLRWPATAAALFYSAVKLAMNWALPLFPAQPRLAPIFNPVTHMWPTGFPLLLVVPALAFDLLLRRYGRAAGKRDWLLAPALGAAFLALFLAAQWPFAGFLLTPHARNWLFAADQWIYTSRPGDWRYRFWTERDPFTPAALVTSFVLATVSARLGLWWGTWMARVRR